MNHLHTLRHWSIITECKFVSVSTSNFYNLLFEINVAGRKPILKNSCT